VKEIHLKIAYQGAVLNRKESSSPTEMECHGIEVSNFFSAFISLNNGLDTGGAERNNQGFRSFLDSELKGRRNEFSIFF
jgi:hypothetical protein